MATHDATMGAIVDGVKGDVCPTPLDAPAKAQLITDCTTNAKAELTSQGFTEASNTLVVTVEEPPADPLDKNLVVMVYSYDHDSTAYKARGPLIPGKSLVVGRDNPN